MSDRTAVTLNGLLFDAEGAIDNLTAPLAEGIAAAVRTHAVIGNDGKTMITPLAYRRIMRDTDRLLGNVYGTRRGDTKAPMYRLIANVGQAAHEAPVRQTIRDIRGYLTDEPELRRRLEGET